MPDGEEFSEMLERSGRNSLFGREIRFGVGLRSLFVVGAFVGFNQTLIEGSWLLGSRFLFGNRNFVHISGTWIGGKSCLERSV